MNKASTSADLVFIHLSDIHFRQGIADDAHDPDRLLRHELELDLRRVRTRFEGVNGLIVSGDVAFGGKPVEYEHATSWLETVCELVGCPADCVMVTPGNHDVDRSLVEPVEVRNVHQKIREAGGFPEYDSRLAAALRDETDGSLLFRPLTAYNTFAAAYNCQVDRDRPFWERDFPLRDGTQLRIRGISTTLLSGPNDHEQTGRMLYGGTQLMILRQPNTRYAIVGHHPPSWSLEGDNAERIFATFSSLQIFGHKHDQWLTRIGESVRLIAGAVHPDRNEPNWQPRYTAICVTALNDAALGLRLYPRRWTAEESKFMADFNSEGHDYRDYTVTVEPRQA